MYGDVLTLNDNGETVYEVCFHENVPYIEMQHGDKLVAIPDINYTVNPVLFDQYKNLHLPENRLKRPEKRIPLKKIQFN